MPSLLYCIPTGNNPTGRTMGDDDRAKLGELCAEYGVRIVADDVYELLQWDITAAARPLRPRPSSACLLSIQGRRAPAKSGERGNRL